MIAERLIGFTWGLMGLGAQDAGHAWVSYASRSRPLWLGHVSKVGQKSPADAADGIGGPEFGGAILVHLDAAYGLARFLTRDGDAAEDVVQDAVLKAHRAFAAYRGGDGKAWLLTIVRRQFLDSANEQRSERGVFRQAEGSDERGDLAPANEDTPEQALLRKGDVEAVRRAIEALPEPFREAIVLRELEELSYRQIAEISQAPIGTVMSRLARGRELLAARLEIQSGAAAPSEERI